MATQAVKKPGSEQPSDLKHKVQKLREIYADATEVSKAALENVIRAVQSGGPAVESVDRWRAPAAIGARRGKVSELTTLFPINPNAAKAHARVSWSFCILASAIKAWTGSAPSTTCASYSWTTTRSCSSAPPTTAIGILTSTTLRPRSPTSWIFSSAKSKVGPGFAAPKVKDFIAKHQVQAYFWYVANPNSTVVETRRLEKIGKAVDEFLDKVG